MFKLTLSFLLLLISATVFASVSNYATEFHVGFLRQVSSNDRIEMIVLTTSQTAVNFNISSPNGFSYTGTATVDSPTTVNISSDSQVRETTFAYRNLGIHVTSDQPISLVLVGYTTAPRSTYLALPTYEQPTQEYIYYGITHSTNDDRFRSQILLVGTRDSTTVTITPSQNVQLPQDPQLSSNSMSNIAAGSNHTVTLHSLQTLLIAASLVDLSGTKIVSNHPLTVIGGHDCAKVPDTASGCDPIATQMAPTINWGTMFLLTPLRGRTDGQKYKITCSEANTVINVNCSTVTSHTLSMPGDIYLFSTQPNQFCSVSCSNPCSVYQLAFSSNFNGFGDPMIMRVPPIRQYPQSAKFATLPQMTSHYSLIVPADQYYNGTVIVNDVLITTEWTPIYSSGLLVGYGYSTDATTNSVYSISHINPNGVIYVSVYGFDGSGGYGYLTGANLDPLTYISFNSSVYFVSEGAGELNVCINRTEKLSMFAIISVKTRTGNINEMYANSHADFVPLNQTVEFLPGETFKLINISIVDDLVTEEIENFTVTIEAIVNNVVILIDQTSVIIEDNDSITIGFASSSLEVVDLGNVRLDVALRGGHLQSGLMTTVLLVARTSGGQLTTLSALNFHRGVNEISVVVNFTEVSLSIDAEAYLMMTNESSLHAIIDPNMLTITHPSVPSVPSVQPTADIVAPTSCTNQTLYITRTVFVASTKLTATVSNYASSDSIGSTASLVSLPGLLIISLICIILHLII